MPACPQADQDAQLHMKWLQGLGKSAVAKRGSYAGLPRGALPSNSRNLPRMPLCSDQA